MLIKKFFNVGFDRVEVVDRRVFGLEDLTRYPLFAPDFMEFLARALPSRRHAGLAYSIVVTARRPHPPSPTGHPHHG